MVKLKASSGLSMCLFLLLFLKQPSAMPRLKRAMCVMACAGLLGSNNKNKELPVSQMESNSIDDGCDCSRADSLHRSRRSVNTTGANSVHPAITTKAYQYSKSSSAEVPTSLPGFMPVPGIRIVPSNTDLSKFSLKPPDPNKPAPTLPRKLLETLYPRLHERLKSCPYNALRDHFLNGTILKAKNVNVSVIFKKSEDWLANVTWYPPEGEEKLVKDYLVIWNLDDERDDEHGLPKVHCKLVPKSQTSLALGEEDGWKYPNVIYLNVLPLPRKNMDGILKSFSPKYPKPIPIPPDRGDPDKQKGAISAGVVFGVVCIGVLFGLLRYKRRCSISIAEEEIEGLTVMELKNNENLMKSSDDLYFGSYLQESEKHTEKVATVASILRGEGYNVVIDQFQSVELSHLGFCRWVDQQFTKAKKILVFCSPEYVSLWNALSGNGQVSSNANNKEVTRVRYEIKRISDMYAEHLSTANIVCINLGKKMKINSELPPWMKHNILFWPDEKDEIIRRIIDQRAMVPFA